MGGLVSYLWWGTADPDVQNPETGLSTRDIYYLRTSWTKVTADSIASGTELLVRYFTKHPEYMKYFHSFKTIPIADLKANRQFQAHSLNIISSITAVVDNIDKPDLAIVMCKKLGTSHSRHRIEEVHFNALSDVMVKLFQDIGFNEPTIQSWVRFVTFMYKNIFSELAPK